MNLKKIIAGLLVLSGIFFNFGCQQSSNEDSGNFLSTDVLEEETDHNSETETPTPDLGVEFLENTSSQECGKHLSAGSPSISDRTLCSPGFAIGYNDFYRQADWVSYYVTSESVQQVYPRSDEFFEDESIPEVYRATLEDYRYSGYARGHLAPRATIDVSEEAMLASFLLSNISPQLYDFNGGVWLDLESSLRDCVEQLGSLYIVTGTAFLDDTTIYANGRLAVPSHFYKVVLSPTEPYAAWGILLRHNIYDKPYDLRPYVLSIKQMESILNKDFFNNVSNSYESSIETYPEIQCELAGINSTMLAASQSSFSCQTKKSCAEMNSCDEARKYYQSCRNESLDPEHNGVPCEDLCQFSESFSD